MSLAAGERKKEMVQIECRWVVFQKVEAATENELRPTVDRRYGGTSSCCVNDDRNRRRPGRFDSMLFLSATPQFDSVIQCNWLHTSLSRRRTKPLYL